MNRAQLAALEVPPESVVDAAALLARLVAVYDGAGMADAVAHALDELRARAHRAALRN